MGPMLGLGLDLVLDLVALLGVLMKVTSGLDPGLIWPVPVVHLVLVCSIHSLVVSLRLMWPWAELVLARPRLHRCCHIQQVPP